jgi:hypothetical protein
LKKNGYRADQVQTFLPSPMALSTAMYHTGVNPLRPVRRNASDPVETVRGLRQRRLHKAFLRYHDPENWPLLREALKEMGRADLIGPGKAHLVPNWQPAGTGRGGEGRRIDPKSQNSPRKQNASPDTGAVAASKPTGQDRYPGKPKKPAKGRGFLTKGLY